MSNLAVVAAPVFSIILVGVLAGRFALFGENDIATLNKFVFRIAIPPALFGLTATAAPPALADLSLVTAYFTAAIIAMAASYSIGRLAFSLQPAEAGAHAFSSVLGNAVFLGLPIAISIEGWARPFVTLMLVEGVFVFAAGVAMMSPRSEGGGLSTFAKNLITPFRNPIIVAMIAGFLFSALGLRLPEPASRLLDLFARAGGPVALFSLGLFLSTQSMNAYSTVAGRITAVTAIKLVALPCAALLLAHIFGVQDTHYIAALALFCFVPTGAFAYILASQFGVYEKESAAAVMVTSILSLVTVSGVLIFFS